MPGWRDSISEHELDDAFSVLDVFCDVAVSAALVSRLEGPGRRRDLALRPLVDTVQLTDTRGRRWHPGN